jgi:hypothetical protein
LPSPTSTYKPVCMLRLLDKSLSAGVEQADDDVEEEDDEEEDEDEDDDDDDDDDEEEDDNDDEDDDGKLDLYELESF